MGGGSQLVLLRYMLLYWDSFLGICVYAYIHTAYMHACIHLCMLDGLVLTLTVYSLVTFGAISWFLLVSNGFGCLGLLVENMKFWNFGLWNFGFFGNL